MAFVFSLVVQIQLLWLLVAKAFAPPPPILVFVPGVDLVPALFASKRQLLVWLALLDQSMFQILALASKQQTAQQWLSIQIANESMSLVLHHLSGSLADLESIAPVHAQVGCTSTAQ